MRHLASLTSGSPPRLRRAVFVPLGGTLLGLSFPPFPFAPLAWLALVPLLCLWLEQNSPRTLFIDAYATFLITFAVAFHWPLFHADADTALISLPALFILPMWMAIPFGLSSYLRRRTGVPVALAALAALYVLMEWGLRRGPFAFPWTLLGHTQAELTPVNGLARFGGVPLLSVYVICLNVLVLTLVARLRDLRLPIAALVVAGTAAAFLPRPAGDRGSVLRVGIIQPAISADEWADIDDARRVGVLLALSDTLAAAASGDETTVREEPAPADAVSAARSLDLVVWPETALPPGDETSRRRVQRWVDAHGVPLITGAIEEGGGGASYYNAAALVRPGGPDAVYRKRRLVPFAEHVPFQNRWPWVRRLAVPSGGVAGYARGESGELMEIQQARFGVLICFETLFDDAARGYAQREADLIVTITQDGWWGDSFGYRQHLAFNRLRAIETGRPIVQVSVSGLSAVIRSDGAIGDRIGWMERRAAVAAVPAGHGDTFFVKTGDWVSPLAAVLFVILSVTAFRRI